MRVFLLLLALVFSTGPALAAKYALVMGNADYESLSDLQNTHYDAQAYGETFQDLGYEVTFLKDLDFDSTLEALDTFYAQINPGDEVVFVFSGHGWSDGKVNYLIPTDAPKQARDSLLKRKTIALKNGYDGVLDELAALGAGLTVAVIDACRNNPFEPPQGRKSLALGRGLAPIQAQTGTLVIFSAGVGQEALDRLPDDPGDQRLSVFTRSFIPHLKSGLYVERAVAEAQKETAALARRAGGHTQTPAIYDEALGDTCLSGSCVYQVTPVVQQQQQLAVAQPSQCDLLYQEAKASRECFEFEGYIDVCADHTFAPIARRFIARQCTVDTAAIQSGDPVKEVAPVVQQQVQVKPVVQSQSAQGTETPQTKALAAYFALQDKIEVKEKSLDLARKASLSHRVSSLEGDLQKLRAERAALSTGEFGDVLAQVEEAQRTLDSKQRSLGLARQFSNPSRVNQLELEVASLRSGLQALRSGEMDALADLARQGEVSQAILQQMQEVQGSLDDKQRSLTLARQFSSAVRVRELEQEVAALQAVLRSLQSGEPVAETKVALETGGPGHAETVVNSEADARVQGCDRLAVDQNHPDILSGKITVASVAFEDIQPDRAIAQCKQAVAAFPDHGRSHANLSRAYGRKGDFANMRVHAERGDALGDLYATRALGYSMLKGDRLPKDVTRGISYLNRAASAGYPMAQNDMGNAYRYGEGVEKDIKLAATWFSVASAQGNYLGQYNMASLLRKGEGVPENMVEARRLYKLSADTGYDYAQNMYGWVLYFGEGGAADPTEGLRWFRMAAAQGNRLAMHNLGRAYAEGKGVTRNDSTSANWYEQAAAQGYSYSQEQLGYIYETGRGVTADPSKAASFYYAALKQGRNWVVDRQSNQWDRETAKAMQRLLKADGFYRGAIDGIMGSGARTAMTAALNAG